MYLRFAGQARVLGALQAQDASRAGPQQVERVQPVVGPGGAYAGSPNAKWVLWGVSGPCMPCSLQTCVGGRCDVARMRLYRNSDYTQHFPVSRKRAGKQCAKTACRHRALVQHEPASADVIAVSNTSTVSKLARPHMQPAPMPTTRHDCAQLVMIVLVTVYQTYGRTVSVKGLASQVHAAIQEDREICAGSQPQHVA